MTRVMDWLTTALFLLLISPALILPYPWVVRGFGATGRALLPLLPFAARVRDNLRLVRPEAGAAEARALTAAVGDNAMRILAEYIRMADFRARPRQRHVEGLEHLRDAAASGRGGLVVSAHYGNWEAIRLAARDAGIELAIIYRAFNNAPFDALSMTRIRLAGEPVMHKGPEGSRRLLRHLKGGGLALVLLDQRLGYGPPTPFLGRPAQTTTTIAALAQRLRVPLIPAVARRRADGLSFDVRFEPPVDAATPEAAMRAINDRISAWIEAEPGQWFWLHRRWKRAA